MATRKKSLNDLNAQIARIANLSNELGARNYNDSMGGAESTVSHQYVQNARYWKALQAASKYNKRIRRITKNPDRKIDRSRYMGLSASNG